MLEAALHEVVLHQHRRAVVRDDEAEQARVEDVVDDHARAARGLDVGAGVRADRVVRDRVLRGRLADVDAVLEPHPVAVARDRVVVDRLARAVQLDAVAVVALPVDAVRLHDRVGEGRAGGVLRVEEACTQVLDERRVAHGDIGAALDPEPHAARVRHAVAVERQVARAVDRDRPASAFACTVTPSSAMSWTFAKSTPTLPAGGAMITVPLPDIDDRVRSGCRTSTGAPARGTSPAARWTTSPGPASWVAGAGVHHGVAGLLATAAPAASEHAARPGSTYRSPARAVAAKAHAPASTSARTSAGRRAARCAPWIRPWACSRNETATRT